MGKRLADLRALPAKKGPPAPAAAAEKSAAPALGGNLNQPLLSKDLESGSATPAAPVAAKWTFGAKLVVCELFVGTAVAVCIAGHMLGQFEALIFYLPEAITSQSD